MLQEENHGFNTSSHKNNAKSHYVLEMDKAKVFWVVVLSLLALTFVFVFGYWTGQNNIKEYTALAKEVASPQSLSLNQNDISAILEEETTTFVTKEENLETQKKAVQDTAFNTSSVPNITKERVENKPVVEKTTKKVQQTKKTSVVTKGRKYAIQLASFKEENKALKLREQLLGKGFGGYVVRIGNFYRVRVGNFTDYNKAANVLSTVMRQFRISDAYIFRI